MKRRVEHRKVDATRALEALAIKQEEGLKQRRLLFEMNLIPIVDLRSTMKRKVPA